MIKTNLKEGVISCLKHRCDVRETFSELKADEIVDLTDAIVYYYNAVYDEQFEDRNIQFACDVHINSLGI